MIAAVMPVPLTITRRSWLRSAIVLLLVVAVLGLLSVFAPNFFKLNNLINILVQASILAVLATGMGVVMIGGGIDLSMPFAALRSAPSLAPCTCG